MTPEPPKQDMRVPDEGLVETLRAIARYSAVPLAPANRQALRTAADRIEALTAENARYRSGLRGVRARMDGHFAGIREDVRAIVDTALTAIQDKVT